MTGSHETYCGVFSMGRASKSENVTPDLEEHHVAGVREDGRNIRGHEVLVLAEADDHGRAIAYRDDRVGIVGGNQHEREEPPEFRQRAAHRGDEPVAATLLLDEMRDDLGVGVRHELVAFGREHALELQVVLDDPVVHDDDPPRTIAVRVRVLRRRAPVRGPARVADPVLALQGIANEHLLELRQLAGAPADVHRAVLHHRDAGGVVPAVFEPPKPFDEHGQKRFGANVADDAAHS
jgi:hypothetical protein